MFETPITPRVSETDGVGHVNNVFVPIWFEAGRRANGTATYVYFNYETGLSEPVPLDCRQALEAHRRQA